MLDILRRFLYTLLAGRAGGAEIQMKKQYIAVPCSYLHDEKKQYAILKRGEPVILAYAENLMEAIEISRFLEETEKEDEEK